MSEQLIRVGTVYIPVKDVNLASDWYVNNLEVQLNYIDEDKAIINLANQSFFLVKARENESANFYDSYGKERFSITFEVDGLGTLEKIHKQFIDKEIRVGEIERFYLLYTD